MTDRHIAAAEAVIAAAENGAYDQQFGITPEHRDLLTRATGDELLSLTDVRALTAAGRHDLIAAAFDADRINLEEN